MFKKLKDKLAEEVKSSPQRIQQFAQAAQAAVTSASSSISDITNSDLFSIGDNDSQQSRSSKSQTPLSSQQNTFQDVTLVQPLQSPSESTEYMSSHDILENQRQRRLSNSSFASDVSFRLPSYETPSMYHLQSDMEVSASEAEERGFSSGAVSLDRVTKEQLYAAYRRTQERYTKYRTQYGDLARHYKLLERENAKARSVLVETQDKALRRISELREQCTLEQSAKAHLEKALRIELEEQNMKIETLTTKVQLLQTNPEIGNNGDKNDDLNKNVEVAKDVPLINLSNDNEVKPPNAESLAEITALNNKIEKMEQLLNKYKESLKTSKEKTSQVTTELQILSNDLENKNKDMENLKNIAHDLAKANDTILDLGNLNEELQNKINVYEFTKTREQSTLEIDFQKSQEEIAELRGKIEVFSKREEEYAISLAENKLSIHKELESKETEIKSLKDSLDITKKEIQSLNIVIDDYKNNVSVLEAERLKLNSECSELALSKTKISDMEMQVEELSKKCQYLEQAKTKADEEYKCLQLQFKQETAEKLAMIDRNVYLESRNTQLSDENKKKSLQVNALQNELQTKEKDLEAHVSEESIKEEILCELNVWKDKYAKLELEIQEERDELIKLQSEIEKLLTNHELLQTQNVEFRKIISDLESDNAILEEKVNKFSEAESKYVKLVNEAKNIRKLVDLISNDAKTIQNINKDTFIELTTQITNSLMNLSQSGNDLNENQYNELKIENSKLGIDLKDNIEKHDTILKQVITLQDENNKLQMAINELQLNKETINQKVQSISDQYENGLIELNSMKERNENLELKLQEYECKIQNLKITAESEKSKCVAAVERLNMIENEKQSLEEKNQEIHIENTITTNELHKMNEEHKNMIDESDVLKKENNILTKELDNRNNDINKLQENIKTLTYENISLKGKAESIAASFKNMEVEINELRKSHTEIEEKNQKIHIENTLTTNELHKMNEEHKNIIEESDVLKKENNILTKELDNRNNDINKFQEDIKTLTYENISLKGKAESIAASFKNMEVGINELRKSHTEIETEKDRLNEVIEKLESNALRNISDKNIQTEDCLESVSIVKDITTFEPLLVKEEIASQEQKVHEISNKVLDTNKTQSIEKEIDNYIQNNNELLENYNTLKTDYDLLRDENRRYMSDIEGLQTYLTKISKENSVLNDKLRELIATSEHCTENDDVSSDLAELKSKVQLEKDKIDDLLRENSLLVEENLELKDQLQSQNYYKPEVKLISDDDKEISGIKEKYNNALQVNSTLESKIIDLEQMNKSVNVNMVQMQEKNEKLRLSNEKLETRLDEALVSLRHLHALQENTELEYLRNILYEYLTGSGTHSVTLAKVLSAIVKFDDIQTQLVLQKEKERQGFLRQLGII